MPTLDEYWNTEEWHERHYDMQLKYVLHDWGAAEHRLNKKWLAEVREEQQKYLLMKALLKRVIFYPEDVTKIFLLCFFDLKAELNIDTSTPRLSE